MAALFICWALLMGLLSQQQVPAPEVPGAQRSLDFEFFKSKVQPIFLAKRPGHARCVACHTGSQAVGFRLQPLPNGRKTWNEEESRQNFEAVKRVVLPGDLRSPLWCILSLKRPVAISSTAEASISSRRMTPSGKS